MGDQQETRLENLSEAIAKAVESEIEAGGINAKDVLAVLCGVIAWVISNTPPSGIANSNLTSRRKFQRWSKRAERHKRKF